MPNRVLKESLRTSKTMALLSGDEERHFIRLLLCADDHGCLEIDPAIIKGTCYPHHHDISIYQVESLTLALEALDLIRRWSDGDRVFAFIPRWDKHSGASFTDAGGKTRNRRKTPIPPDSVKSPKTSNKPALTIKTNELSQQEPARATEGPVLVSVSGLVPKKKDLSTNVGGNQQLSSVTPAIRSGIEPRAHRNNNTEIDLIINYATEVLNKLEGVTENYAERKDRPTLLRIAQHVPRHIVHRALEETQDATQRHRDGLGAYVNVGRYFTSRVSHWCSSEGIKSPFSRNGTSQDTKVLTGSNLGHTSPE